MYLQHQATYYAHFQLLAVTVPVSMCFLTLCAEYPSNGNILCAAARYMCVCVYVGVWECMCVWVCVCGCVGVCVGVWV